MARVSTKQAGVDYAKAFGKAAIELGDNAWKAWKADVWQPLGVKDRTAQQRADSKGQGGTRAAMLAIMAHGFDNQSLAMVAAAYVRNRYLGNTSTNTNGISYGWFTVYANMSTVASNAVFKADSKGNMRMVAATRKAAPSKAKAASDSRNGEVRVVRESDKVREQALADIAATVESA